MEKIPNIVSVKVRKDYILKILFDDGYEKELDVEPFIKSGVSAPLKDQDYFKTVTAENGYITWPNGFDFCPEFIRNYL